MKYKLSNFNDLLFQANLSKNFNGVSLIQLARAQGQILRVQPV